MRLGALSAIFLASSGLVQSRIVTSTIFWGNCWTDADGGTITTSLPGATATYHDPATITETSTYWLFDKKRAELEDRGLTVVEINQCTETDTAYVVSTVSETVATLTTTLTEYASTATVTMTTTCINYECFF